MRMDVEDEFDIEGEYFGEGEISLPPSAELVGIEQAFKEVLDNPQAIRDLVRKKYVPQALMAYVDLLSSPDVKIKKAAADSILEIADVKGTNRNAGGIGMVNFNLGSESQGNLMKALGALSQGEIIQEAEVLEDG